MTPTCQFPKGRKVQIDATRLTLGDGMGILERLNKTFKHDFAFRHEPETLSELRDLVPRFKQWYNQTRIHSSVGYTTPWQKLQEQATLA